MTEYKLERKVCPKCNLEKNRSQLARHMRTCKGPSSAMVACKYCDIYFRKAYLKRHMFQCKYRLQLENKRIRQIEELRKSLEESLAINNALVNEKAQLAIEKAALAVQLCKEMDVSNALKITLEERTSDLKERLSKKELEYTRHLARIRSTGPIVINNYYNHYAVHMTPWCLDPKHPDYKKTLEGDVQEYKEQFAVIPARPPVQNDYDKQYDTRRRYIVFSNTLKTLRLGVPNPYYIILDTARRKGLFVMPDGSTRVDPGMGMIMNHHYAISNGIDPPHPDWFYLLPEHVARLKNMIKNIGGRNASRLRDIKERETT